MARENNISTLIKSIRNIMRTDTGVDGDAQRIGQLAWLIFLKVFDVMEMEWELNEDNYNSIIPEGLRWRDWAADDEGITGDKLLNFVNEDLYPTLKSLEVHQNADPKVFIVREFFGESYNYMKSGILLRKVINKLNSEVDFTINQDRHLFNDIYESLLKELQSAGDSGEYYTPRPVTQFMTDMVNPKLGEKVLDFACGTGGFLVCALTNISKQIKNIEDQRILKNSINGVEKKQLPYMLAVTNLMLHGESVPNIKHGNLLGEKDVRDYKESEKVDIILTNPPFGGAEEDMVIRNFPSQFRTKETADMFMVLLMYMLKSNGRGAIVLPDGFLFGDGIKNTIKERLLTEFNLHTLVRLPHGVFAPYTDIKTNLLFFDKGKSTEKIWYFEHPLPLKYKQYTKTKPIKIEEFELEKEWWNNREENKFAWFVGIDEIKKNNYNLDIKNPTTLAEEIDDPEAILAVYNETSAKVTQIQNEIKTLLADLLKEDS